MHAYITADSILTNVKQILRITNNDNNTFLRSLILEGARNLTTVETLIVEDCTVTVENNKFYLPDKCKQLIAFRTKNGCIPGIMLDIPFFKHCGCNTIGFNSLVPIIDINGRWANLLNTVPDGTEIEIAFVKIDVDEQGMPKINEEAYTALSMRAAYMFALSYVENYTAEQRREWKGAWKAQADRVRSLAARRVFEQQKEQIQKKMGTMVNSAAPLGLLSGVYNSFFYPTVWSISNP